MALSTEDRESSTRREGRAPDFYQAYLNSPAWRKTRNDALRRAGYKCERCGVRRDFNVHHRSYARLGNEVPADLEVLCFTCHNGHHQQEAEGTSLGLFLKLVSEVLERDAWKSIADISDEVKQLCAKRHIPNEPEKIQKAIAMVCATRLRDDGKPYQSVVDVWNEATYDPVVSHAQAVEFLARLRLGRDAQAAILKPMPRVELVSEREAARRKALEMVAMEMQASIARCEALERDSQ